jgi:hypothetical protein
MVHIRKFLECLWITITCFMKYYKLISILILWHNAQSRIVKSEETSIARQRIGKQIPVATNKLAATE